MKKVFFGLIIFSVMGIALYAQDSYGKLIQNLAGVGNGFRQNETVFITQYTIRAIDLSRSGEKNVYLVAINDNNWGDRLKPFYIETTETFNLIDLGYYPNTIPHGLTIQYVGMAQYLFNKIPRDTYLFRYSIPLNTPQNNNTEVKSNNIYKYRIMNGKTIRIIEYIGTENDVSIPNIIDGFPVTEIARQSFYNKKITNVIFPNTIKKIEAAAFQRNNLTKIVLPDSIEIIVFDAFADNQLNEVVLPKNLDHISASLFFKNNITSIVIPNSVKTISEFAFHKNPITKITIGANVGFYDTSKPETPPTNPFSNGEKDDYSARFKEFYEKNGKKAGVYTYINGAWTYSVR